MARLHWQVGNLSERDRVSDTTLSSSTLEFFHTVCTLEIYVRFFHLIRSSPTQS